MPLIKLGLNGQSMVAKLLLRNNFGFKNIISSLKKYLYLKLRI